MADHAHRNIDWKSLLAKRHEFQAFVETTVRRQKSLYVEPVFTAFDEVESKWPTEVAAAYVDPSLKNDPAAKSRRRSPRWRCRPTRSPEGRQAIRHGLTGWHWSAAASGFGRGAISCCCRCWRSTPMSASCAIARSFQLSFYDWRLISACGRSSGWRTDVRMVGDENFRIAL